MPRIIDGRHLQKSHLSARSPGCITRQLLPLFEEAFMNNLHMWLSQQHHGLRTFKTFQQKLETLSRQDPAQRALYALLSNLRFFWFPTSAEGRAFEEGAVLIEFRQFGNWSGQTRSFKGYGHQCCLGLNPVPNPWIPIRCYRRGGTRRGFRSCKLCKLAHISQCRTVSSASG